MDRAKVFKDYFVSSQNTVLIPNEDFGKRKFLNVGINRSLSLSRIEEITQSHTQDMRSANKQWLHPPDAISRGHILYLVKFLGECEVECPKGTDIVKDAIRKRKFNKSLRKTEGQKTPRVELSISIDGVTIQDPKTKMVLHRYPLHRISYCADDKSDKRMFTFIAKAADTNKHFCYVFGSDKNAEEITLTIGQAFDLAYRRFLDTQGKDMDTRKQQLLLQKKVDTLEKENEMLKLRIRELELLKDRTDVENYRQNHQISDLTSVATTTAGPVVSFLNNTGESSTDSPESSQQNSPKSSGAGRRLENLVFDTGSPQPVTNGTTQSPRTPGMISSPPPTTRSRHGGRAGQPATPTTPQQAPPIKSDIDELATVFSPTVPPQQQNSFNNNHVFDPFSTPGASGGAKGAPDPFGMASFNPDQGGDASSLSKQDKDFLDLQAGFSQGLSFGTEEFGMDSFDPLNQSTDQ